MKLEILMRFINLDEKVQNELMNYFDKDCFENYRCLFYDLKNPLRAKETYERIKLLIGEDQFGFKMLTVQLRSACLVFNDYVKKGISEDIYMETMKCFTRFTNEHFDSFGYYGFDRSWWTYRQLSLQLFRIGELEYELYEHQGEKMISIHIPTDAKLLETNIIKSIEKAKKFFKKYFPEYQDVKYYCHSWLISSDLKKLLNNDSNILKFQSLFTIVKDDYDSDGFYQWIYKKRYDKLEDLPENTSLQKNLKKYLLEGNKLSTGLGILN